MTQQHPFTMFIRGVAVPQGSKTAMVSASTKRAILVDSNPKLADWRNTVTSAAIDKKRDYDGVYVFPFAGPVAVTITFVMSRPKYHYRSGKNSHLLAKLAPNHPSKAPDIDKLVRGILDALTAAQVWVDDGQVAWLQAAKRYTDRTPLNGPGVHIQVAEL